MNEHLDHRGRPRVVVTGVGLQTPAGAGLEAVWATLLAGRSVAATIERFDPSPLSVRFGCEIRDFDPVPYLGPKESRRVDRAAQLGYAAVRRRARRRRRPGRRPGSRWRHRRHRHRWAHHARGAGQDLHREGAGPGQPVLRPDDDGQRHRRDHRHPSRLDAARTSASRPRAPPARTRSAKAPGSSATGSADVVMAGGTECAITPPAVAAFARMGALSKRNDEPELASRPFDADRDGFVMGEGAGMVVLERADRAAARGARIYGEIAGYGTNSDAFHITAPSQGGAGAAACMQLAIDDAGLTRRRHRPRQRARHVDRAQRLRRGRGDPQGVRRRGAAGHVDQGRDRSPHRCGRRGRGDRRAAVRTHRAGAARPRTITGSATTSPRSTSCTASPATIAVAPALSNSFGFGGHNAALVLVPAP